MLALRSAVLSLLVATSLAAQTPPAPSDSAPAASVAPRRSAFFDVAALVDNEQRFGFEPLVFGRWTIGLVRAHRGAQQSQTLYPPIATIVPCTAPGCFPTTNSSGYSAWSLDLAVRYYPAFLSAIGPGHRLMVYAGEFVGYSRRTLTLRQPVVPAAGGGANPTPPITGNPVSYSPGATRQRFDGWEPGAEIGARIVPLGPLFVDVGGWFKLVTIDDPTQRLRPGQVDARLVAAVGIGW